MQVSPQNLILRDDTFLGVCEALGEDFRINSNFIRVAFALPLLWNPLAVVGAYVGVGIFVLLTRLIAPNPRDIAEPREARVGAGLAAETGVQRPGKGHDNARAHDLAAAA